MTKILGAGMHKTGTTSLGAALRVLGLRTTGWQEETASLYKRGHTGALVDMMADFDGFEDAPWYLMYEVAYERYPDLRLVLTRRSSMDVWFESLTKHIDRVPPDAFSFRSLLYGTDDLVAAREHVIDVHSRHLEAVRAFAAAHDVPLLEVCWESGDGWPELCGFLGVGEPDEPFPHANAAPGRAEASRQMIRALRAKVRR